MLKIVPITKKNLPAVSHLERELYPNPWSQKSFENVLAQKPFWFWVAKKENAIVGYLVCQVVGEEAELHNIAVAKPHQRRGIAKKLLEKLIETLKEKGVQKIYLMVRASNGAAKNLYERFGFENIDIRKNYYHSPDEDALMYRFDILENPSLMKKIRRALKQEKEGSVWKKSSKGKWTRAKALKH